VFVLGGRPLLFEVQQLLSCSSRRSNLGAVGSVATDEAAIQQASVQPTICCFNFRDCDFIAGTLF
jgi:hypothetical protein